MAVLKYLFFALNSWNAVFQRRPMALLRDLRTSERGQGLSQLITDSRKTQLYSTSLVPNMSFFALGTTTDNP